MPSNAPPARCNRQSSNCVWTFEVYERRGFEVLGAQTCTVHAHTGELRCTGERGELATITIVQPAADAGIAPAP